MNESVSGEINNETENFWIVDGMIFLVTGLAACCLPLRTFSRTMLLLDSSYGVHRMMIF